MCSSLNAYIHILFIFSWGGRIALGWLWWGPGYCALSCSRCFNQSAFLEFVSHPAGIASFFLGFRSKEKGQQSLGNGEARLGLVLLQAPGCCHSRVEKAILLGGGGPFRSRPSLLGSHVPNLCESLRNVSLLCIGGFREQNLNYDATVTILASNICFVNVEMIFWQH